MVAHHGYQLPYTEDPWKRVADWRLLGATRFRNNNNAAKMFPRFDGLLAANRLIESDLVGQGYKNVFYAPGGVDHKLFQPFTVSRHVNFTVGWCAQHDPDKPNNKGWRVLEQVRNRFKNYTDVLFLVQNASHNLCPRKPDDMPSWYNSIDCLLVTSVSEGTPLTAQEAMACGRPVIGTEVGILPELISHNHNGFLVDPCFDNSTAINTVEWITARIKQLKDDRKLCRAMGENARLEILNNWTWKDRAQDYIHALEAVANGT
jgi:glycosyltransferase involved in cell wall biosynthesis